jgi:hypothetical protein
MPPALPFAWPAEPCSAYKNIYTIQTLPDVTSGPAVLATTSGTVKSITFANMVDSSQTCTDYLQVPSEDAEKACPVGTSLEVHSQGLPHSAGVLGCDAKTYQKTLHLCLRRCELVGC